MPVISTLSDSERELVKKEIATFLLGTDQRLIDRRALAEQLHALPLYSDMGGCILLEPTGQLVLVHSNQSYFGPVEVSSDADATGLGALQVRRYAHEPWHGQQVPHSRKGVAPVNGRSDVR